MCWSTFLLWKVLYWEKAVLLTDPCWVPRGDGALVGKVQNCYMGSLSIKNRFHLENFKKWTCWIIHVMQEIQHFVIVRTVFLVSLPSHHDILHKLLSSLVKFQFFQGLGHKMWTCDNIRRNFSKSFSRKNGSQSCGVFLAVPPTYFFWVSPAFTRIRRTSNTGLEFGVFQDQIDFLNFFHTEPQELASPSQLRRIFSRSPMFFSVNTKKVLVKFRPIIPS